MADGATSEILDEIEAYKDTVEGFDDTAALDCLALFVERNGLAAQFSVFIDLYTSGEATRQPFPEADPNVATSRLEKS